MQTEITGGEECREEERSSQEKDQIHRLCGGETPVWLQQREEREGDGLGGRGKARQDSAGFQSTPGCCVTGEGWMGPCSAVVSGRRPGPA